MRRLLRGRKTLPSSSFREFYERTLPPLCRHLQALGLRYGEDLEDVLQNTYLQAHTSFHELREPRAELAWLFTIGRRQYARYVARRVRTRRVFADPCPDQDALAMDVADLRAALGDDELITKGLCKQILAIMEQVDRPVRRLALQLFFLEDLSLKEISEQTHTNVSTLTTWISRFRQQVQARLGPLGDEAEASVPVREVF